MANFRGHFTTSAVLGVAYGAAAAFLWQFSWGPVLLGTTLTALGGLLPDLDSDSGIPIRWLFTALGFLTPFVLWPRLTALNLPPPLLILALGALYFFVRYGLSEYFKRMTVHRGMFHSIPGLWIAGLAVFLMYNNDHLGLRFLMAGGVMIGFLSHLVLDELYSVDLRGFRIRLNRMAGSALKWASPSIPATAGTYAILAGLVYLTLQVLEKYRM